MPATPLLEVPMRHSFAKAVLGAAAALMIGGAAQAGHDDVVAGDRASYRQVQYYVGGYGYGYDRGDRYHGGGYGYGHHGGYSYGRPVAERPHWGGHQRCHQITKRRINRWGEAVVKHITRCH